MTDIQVNDVTISADAIAAEAQHHPAGDIPEALAEAALALAVRELLRQEALRLGVQAVPERDADGRRESEEEARIRALLTAEIRLPEADDAACRRYYENNRRKFATPELVA